jgi:two-component system, NarL family, nitrate/nitrite response regulator NarL
MTETVGLLLVDDHPVFLDGMRLLFAAETWISHVAIARTGAEAMERCAATKPDVAVVDLRLPDGDGVELTRRMLAARPTLRVLLLTMHADFEAVLRALASGAAGYLLKDSEPEDVRAAVRQVARGGMVVGAGVGDPLRLSIGGAESPDLTQLRPRDRQLLSLLAEGLSTAAIASRLHVTPKTVRNRLSELFARLGINSRSEAIVIARDAGLGRP